MSARRLAASPPAVAQRRTVFYHARMKVPPLRDAAFILAFSAGLLLTAGAGVSLAILLFNPRLTQALSAAFVHPWWFVYLPGSGGTHIVWEIAAVAAVSILALASALRARAHYVRSGSPLALFFIAYFLTLSVECLRAASAVVYAGSGPVTAVLIMSRAVYGGRFAGELILLAVGLYALDLKLKKYIVILGIILLVAFAIALYMPVDSTVFLSSLVFNLGDEQGTAFAMAILAALTPLSLVGAGLRTKNRAFSTLAVSSILMIAGNQMLDFSPHVVVFTAGLLAFIVGTGMALSVLSGYSADENA